MTNEVRNAHRLGFQEGFIWADGRAWGEPRPVCPMYDTEEECESWEAGFKAGWDSRDADYDAATL